VLLCRIKGLKEWKNVKKEIKKGSTFSSTRGDDIDEDARGSGGVSAPTSLPRGHNNSNNNNVSSRTSSLYSYLHALLGGVSVSLFICLGNSTLGSLHVAPSYNHASVFSSASIAARIILYRRCISSACCVCKRSCSRDHAVSMIS